METRRESVYKYSKLPPLECNIKRLVNQAVDKIIPY
jgi:hypothetical protein